MAKLVTLTRNTSLKRPMQLMAAGKDVLDKMNGVTNKLSSMGYNVIWNDNPKAILTKVTHSGLSSYCCVACELEPSLMDKLSKSGIEIIQCDNLNIIIIDEKDQMTALNKLYGVIGRISII